jgi:serine/threonine protein phosphatase PrpC
MVQSGKTDDGPPAEEVLPAWDTPEAVPVALPVPADAVPADTGPLPVALPVATPVERDLPLATPVEGPTQALAAAAADEVRAPEPVKSAGAAVAESPSSEEAPAVPHCPVCGAANPSAQPSCGDCGYYFSEADLVPVAMGRPAGAAGEMLQGQYELREMVGQRKQVTRFRALDYLGGKQPVPVVVVREPLPALTVAEPGKGKPAEAEDSGDEILPTFDDAAGCHSATAVLAGQPNWPSIAWERRILRTLDHPALPTELAYFCDDDYEYVVEQVPAGRPLWDAWDDPQATARERFAWLSEVAEVLHRLHQVGAMVEGLRPDLVVIAEDGTARLTDLSDLLPLPFPAGTPVRGLLYTAPELLAGQVADARTDLYGFGAMLYALHVGRELTEVDFEPAGAGHPKPFVPRFPDVHPAFGRLMLKTFCRAVEGRFPTDEAAREDATGFVELIRTLDVLGRTYDDVRLEIASWTTTGIVRTGNEDAFALLHACESRQDDVSEAALVLLCDGMGGYEAGEVAAALAIQVLRQTLLKDKPFSALAGASGFATDALAQTNNAEGHAAAPLDVEACKKRLKAALKEANRQVFAAARAPGTRRRGMGCTAEAVYVDGRNVVVGHVGDSRTYHLHEGRMLQLTRDQTLVNRLVELGTLTPEEAETHPRRNELQQAIGGQPDVEPGLYAGRLVPGDWVVVCSDGLSNHVTAKELQQMLQGEATSAEMAARRLVNLVNIEGATDNATVVVIRAT